MRAWRLAARVVEQAIAAGGDVPDFSRFAAAFPPSAHAVGVVDETDEDGGLISMDPLAAVTIFAEASMRALAAAVRDPKILTSPDVHPVELDLSRLQPSLRAVAPELGAVAPVVQLRDTLDLTLTLELPEPDSGAWPLRAVPSDPGLLKRAAHIYPPLSGMVDGAIDLDVDAVAELRLAASALEFSGVKLILPSQISDPVDLQIDDAELRLVDGPLSLTGTRALRPDRLARRSPRSAKKSSGRWHARRSRWCGSVGSGGRSQASRCCAPNRWRRLHCTDRACPR